MSDKHDRFPDHIHAEPKEKPRLVPDIQMGEEKPISPSYPEIDNDLARDNLENDIPAADLHDI